MMNSLSKAQIEQIRTFIAKKGFTYTDLSLEILDHVACKVQEKLNEDPNLTFENALTKTHAEFGVMGFSALEESFKKLLNGKYKQVVLQELRTWLSAKHIGLVIGFMVLFFGLTKMIPYAYLASFAVLLNVSTLIYYFFRNNKSFKEFKKMLAVKTSIAYIIGIIVSIQIWAQSAVLWSRTTENSSFLYLFDILFPILFILNVFLLKSLFLVTDSALDRCEKLNQQLIHTT